MSRNVVHNILLIDYVTYVNEIKYFLMFLYLSEKLHYNVQEISNSYWK